MQLPLCIFSMKVGYPAWGLSWVLQIGYIPHKLKVHIGGFVFWSKCWNWIVWKSTYESDIGNVVIIAEENMSSFMVL